jgi:tetratricopeptide (TPR) repeat protein
MKLLRLDEIEGINVFDTLVWKPIRRPLGVTAFGINAYTAANEGDLVVEKHDETTLGHEEIYVVVRGHATFTVDGEEVDAPEGTLVYLDEPKQRRSAIAREAGTTVLAIGGVPGKHEPSAWEFFFPALPMMKAGEWTQAKEVVLEGIAVRPDHPALLYNLACCEANLGETDAAIEHLTKALDAKPEWREDAKRDRHLEPIREDQRFPA